MEEKDVKKEEQDDAKIKWRRGIVPPAEKERRIREGMDDDIDRRETPRREGPEEGSR